MKKLILSLGSNLGDKNQNLINATTELCKSFGPPLCSKVYTSDAVGYIEQPSFFNIVLEFNLIPKKIPSFDPQQVIKITQEIERKMGRKKTAPKGPRIIDIDVLFIDLIRYSAINLEIPHPRLFERSFIAMPLSELSSFAELSKCFNFTSQFDNTCKIEHAATAAFNQTMLLSFP